MLLPVVVRRDVAVLDEGVLVEFGDQVLELGALMLVETVLQRRTESRSGGRVAP